MNPIPNILKLAKSADAANRKLSKQLLKAYPELEGKVKYRLQREKRKIGNGRSLFEVSCCECPIFGQTGLGRCPVPLRLLAGEDTVSIFLADQIGITAMDEKGVRLQSDCQKRKAYEEKPKPKRTKAAPNQIEMF